MRKIQHTAETCPGKPCSSECDHIEFVRTQIGWLVTLWERTGSGPKKMWEHVHIMTKKMARNAAIDKLKEDMLDSDVIVWLNKNHKAVVVNGEGDLIHSIFATLERVYFYKDN